jgi:type VI secretion system protein ImpH
MFVKAHRKYRLASAIQISEGSRRNAAIDALLSIAGFSGRSVPEHDRETFLFHCGFFADQRRTAINLQRMLQDFTGLPISVKQFQMRRLEVDPSEQTALAGAAGANAILGVSTMAGKSQLDRRGAIRIVIGPLRYPAYLTLLPDRKTFSRIVALASAYCGQSIAFDLQIILRKEDVPALRIESGSPVGRLGWDCWLLNGPSSRDAEDAVFDPSLTSGQHGDSAARSTAASSGA